MLNCATYCQPAVDEKKKKKLLNLNSGLKSGYYLSKTFLRI